MFNNTLNEIKTIIEGLPYAKTSYKNLSFNNRQTTYDLCNRLSDEITNISRMNFDNLEEQQNLIQNRFSAINTIGNQLDSVVSTLSFNYNDKGANRIVKYLEKRLDEDDSKDNTHLILDRFVNVIRNRREYLNRVNEDRQNPIRTTYVEICANPVTRELYASLSWGIVYNPDKIISNTTTTVNNATIRYYHTQYFNLLQDNYSTDFEPIFNRIKNQTFSAITKKPKKPKVNRKEIGRQSYPDTYMFNDKYSRIYECDVNGVRFKYRNNSQYIRDKDGYYFKNNNGVWEALNVKSVYNCRMSSLFKTIDFDRNMTFKVLKYGSPFSIVKILGMRNEDGFIINMEDTHLLYNKYFAVPTKVDRDEKYHFSKRIVPVPTAILYEAEIPEPVIPNDDEKDEIIESVNRLIEEYDEIETNNDNDVPDVPDNDNSEYDSDTDTDEYTEDHYKPYNFTVADFQSSL